MKTAPDDLEGLLSRPISERLREHKYRFAQSVVFGLPVVGLQLFGGRLGGISSGIWVGLLQALLSGWVMYVAAAGMLFEGVLLLRRGRVTADAVVAMLAVMLYAAGIIAWAASKSVTWGLMAWAVAVAAVWTGARWWWLSRAG